MADAERLVRLARDRPVHLVAISYGGIAAVLAAQCIPERVQSLTLFEPACADLARTAASVRALARSFEPVTALRGDPTVSDLDFVNAYGTALGSALPQGERGGTSTAKRLRSSPLPWEVPIPLTELRVPTLVVTGGWSDFYEDIADALAAAGAQRWLLPGFGHAVAHHPDATLVLDSLISGKGWT